MAPHYVKKVVAQVEEEEKDLKTEKKSKSRPQSMTRMAAQTKSKATQVSFDLVSGSVSGTVETEEAGTQYEELLSSSGDLLDKPEKVESVEISRVLLSGRADGYFIF